MRRIEKLMTGWAFTDLQGNRQVVELPHTWNNKDGQDGGNNYARGTYVYDNTFAKPTFDVETEDFALAGISHVMCDIRWSDVTLPGWELVMQQKDFKLYANPDFKGRYFLNENMPVKANWRTCNRINMTIPAHARSLTVLESFHSGWKAYAGGQELPIVPTERGGMYITLPQSESEYELLMEFHMPYRLWYYSIMIAVFLVLGFVHLKQK